MPSILHATAWFALRAKHVTSSVCNPACDKECRYRNRFSDLYKHKILFESVSKPNAIANTLDRLCYISCAFISVIGVSFSINGNVLRIQVDTGTNGYIVSLTDTNRTKIKALKRDYGIDLARSSVTSFSIAVLYVFSIGHRRNSRCIWQSDGSCINCTHWDYGMAVAFGVIRAP